MAVNISFLMPKLPRTTRTEENMTVTFWNLKLMSKWQSSYKFKSRLPRGKGKALESLMTPWEVLGSGTSHLKLFQGRRSLGIRGTFNTISTTLSGPQVEPSASSPFGSNT